ncbi:MAG: YccF domain-containing protein [Kineosporiaceae bacterium]
MTSPLAVILNVLWLIVAGVPLVVGYAVAGLLAFLLIVTIPFGIACFRLAGYALWPFGRTVVIRRDAGVASALGNVVWFLLIGWWLAIGQILWGVGLMLTIVGIPFGYAAIKIALLSFNPLGKDVIDADTRGYLPAVPSPSR